jgi:hypothetical protein
MPSYSASVEIYLALHDRHLRIGHLGPNYVILDDPIDAPPSDAQLSLSVDGATTCWPIHLPEGLSAADPRVPIALRK